MVQKLNKIVLVGANSAMAKACAQLWLKDQVDELILIGRNIEKLYVVAADLKVRSPSTIFQCVVADFLSPSSIQVAVEQTFINGPVDIALIAHGFLPNQQDCQSDLYLAQEVIHINGVSPVLFAEAFVKNMLAINYGKLLVISSVAGDRGRKSNYVYGAAKSLLSRYIQGLQHRLAYSGIKIILVKPGPTDTPMTASMKANGLKLAALDQVAKNIVVGAKKNKPVIYAPAKWQFIMLLIQHLPNFIFKKLDI